jgi:hypothetical protein
MKSNYCKDCVYHSTYRGDGTGKLYGWLIRDHCEATSCEEGTWEDAVTNKFSLMWPLSSHGPIAVFIIALYTFFIIVPSIIPIFLIHMLCNRISAKTIFVCKIMNKRKTVAMASRL